MTITPSQAELIAAIYETILTPEAWPDVLQHLADLVGARTTNFVISDYCLPEVQVSWAGPMLTPALIADYNENHWAEEKPAIMNILKHGAGEFVTDEQMVAGVKPLSEFKSIAWARKNFGGDRRTCVRLNVAPSWLDMLTFHMPIGTDTLTPEQQDAARVFLPHLAKATELSRPVHLLKLRFRAVLAALDRFHIGVFVVLPSGSVLVQNTEAQRILDQGRELLIDSTGRLRANAPDDQKNLAGAMTSCASTASGTGVTNGSRFEVRRAAEALPLFVEVSPVRDTAMVDDMGSGAAIVFVVDPSNYTVASTAGMERLFDLTEAEAAVCELLADGFTVDQIAEMRNVAPSTVRSQIKTLFQKTGVNRQAHLIRLALSINIPVDSG